MSQSGEAKRFYEIDAARSAVMFIALFIHAGAIYCADRVWITPNADRSHAFTWFIEGLHLFISPAFFVVAGFFTSLLLPRYGAWRFFLKRNLRAGLPLLVIVLTFNVYENYLRYTHTLPSSGIIPSFATYLHSANFIETWTTNKWQLHIWFLVQLILSFLTAIGAYLLLSRLPRIIAGIRSGLDRLGIHTRNHKGFLALLLALPCLEIAVAFVCSLLPHAYDYMSIGVAIRSPYAYLQYIVYFAFGAAIYASSHLYSSTLRWRNWMLAAAILAFAIQAYPPDNISGHLENAFWIYVHNLCRWTLILFFLQFFHRYFSERPHGITAFLSDASMSLYLFHHCMVYVFGTWFVGIQLPILLEWLIIVLITATIVLSFHHLVVARFGVARLILNGQTDGIRRKKNSEG